MTQFFLAMDPGVGQETGCEQGGRGTGQIAQAYEDQKNEIGIKVGQCIARRWTVGERIHLKYRHLVGKVEEAASTTSFALC